MQKWMVPLLVATTVLAGCSDSASDEIGAKGSGQTWKFTSPITGDSYRWDMGDRLTIYDTKDVEHTYDFAVGTVTVRLTVMKDGVRNDFNRVITVGEGTNSAPDIVLEAETNWTIPGETVRFSGAASTDPEGDPMRYSWNCIRTGDAIRQAVHSHPAAEGAVPFGTGGASAIGRLAEGPMPEADVTIEGDLCEALLATAPSRDATIAGTFEQTGIYDVVMVASDGPNPTRSVKFTIYVTAAEDRPDPIYTETFTGQLGGGSGGSAQGVGDQAGMVLDRVDHTFALSFQAHTLNATVTYDGGVANSVTVSLLRGSNVRAGPDQSVQVAPAQDGGWTARIQLEQGAQVNYELQIEAQLDMTPGIYF